MNFTVTGIIFLSLVYVLASKPVPHGLYGSNDDYFNGEFNTGKLCVNMWEVDCVNIQLNGAGHDDDYLYSNFNSGKRCVNMWDEGCVNGQLPGAGDDDDYLNNGFNPGKRSINEILQKLHLQKKDNQ